MQKKEKEATKTTTKQIDFVLLVIIILLLALGIIMVLSASAPSALSESGNSYTYVTKQAIFAVFGFIVMFACVKFFDYRILKKLYWPIYWISVGILLLVLVPGIGASANGATRWIDLGFTTFQPSELTKVGMIIFYAGYLSEHRNELRDFKKGFIKPLIFLMPPVLIAFLIQNHLSVGLVMGAITVVMMIMAGCRMSHFVFTGLTAGGLGGGALVLYLMSNGNSGANNFRLDRILSFLDPWADPTGTGWQAINSLYAIGSGGLFGVGLGESKQKYLYIPEPQNDFIFSILAEELGFIGCTFVIILFALFVWRGILIAMKAPDMFSSLLATGITTLVMVQVVINIGVVTNSIPNTGMPLPFFSAGGTALVILLGMCGILLNISKSSSKV